MAPTKAEDNVPPRKPRIEVLMERNAKQRKRAKGAYSKILCRCQHRYINKTKTEDRNCISKKRYINILSTPRKYQENPNEAPRKRKKPIVHGPCPPRIEELARPNPTRILNTWQMYNNVLSPERMDKIQNLLYSISYMDPKKAIYHFKRVKAQNKRLKKKAAKKKKTPPPPSITQLTWMQREEMQTAKVIIEHFKNKPLVSVKYRHMCISDKILDTMCDRHLLRKPKRKTKNSYEKSILEIADHIAVWFDKLVEDLEASERKEAEEAGIEEVTSSVALVAAEEGEGEEEEEEEESEESEEWSFASAGVQVPSLLLGEEGMLDEELLRKLIEILESGAPDLLDGMIDPEALPGITYGDVLRQLKDFEYTGESVKSARGERLDAAMAEWATNNDSEKFDTKLRELVKFLAGILAHLLFLARAGKFGEEEEELSTNPSEGEYPPGYEKDLRFDGPRTADDYRRDELDASAQLGEGRGGVYEDDLGGGEGATEEPITSGEVSPFGDERGSRTESISEMEMTEGGEGTGDIMEVSSLEEGDEAAAEGERLLEEGYWEGARPEDGFYGEAEADEEAELIRRQLEAEEAAAEAAEAAEGEEEKAGLGEREITTGAQPPAGKETTKDVIAAGPAGVVLGHKPSITFEHTPDGICCISLKIYALWLYEVAENAHNWSSWLIDVIQEVRNFTRIVKGEVMNPDGSKRVLKKDEWRKFVEKVEKMIVSWRQYSQHIASLSDRLMKTIHEKKVTCCPKCLSDNLIKDLAAANCLTDELIEGITSATYWRQWLDNMIDQTKRLTTIPLFVDEAKKALPSRQKKVCTCGAKPPRKTMAKRPPSPFAPKQMVQVHKAPRELSSSDEDEESIYEIEEIDQNKPGPSRRP